MNEDMSDRVDCLKVTPTQRSVNFPTQLLHDAQYVIAVDACQDALRQIGDLYFPWMIRPFY